MWTHLKYWKPPFLPVIVLLVLLSDNIISGTVNAETEIKITHIASETTIEFFLENGEGYIISSVTCKGVKGDYSGSQPHICENLEPCTTYIATIIIQRVEGDVQDITDQTLNVITTYATPQVELLDVIPDQFSLLIKWNAINRSCISTFDVTVKSSDKEYGNSIQNDKDSIEFGSLNPCQLYNIQITTTDVNKEMIGDPIEATSTTHYAEPENIVGITFEVTDEDAMKVVWEPPKYKTCIQYFYLKWSTVECITELGLTQRNIVSDNGTVDNNVVDDDDGVCKWNVKNMTDTNTKEFVMLNLDGCEEYGVVFFINDDPAPKSELSEFNSTEQIPSGIIYGTHNINSTAVNVVWSPPKQNSKCVKFYTVEVFGPLQRDPELQQTYFKETNETSAEFVALDPCGEYTIQIQAKSLNGSSGVQISSSVSTDEDSPTVIRNAIVEARPNELVLQWDPPEFAELCLDGYRISGWYDSSNQSVFDKTTNETHIIVDNLISCQAYTVQIIPYTKSKDGALEHIEQITSPMVAAAPYPFQSTVIHSHSFELSARVQNEDYLSNKCQTLFARFVCETTADVPYKNAIQYVEGRLGDVSFKAAISPLSPFTEYICKVDLYNTAGWSDFTLGVFTTDKYYPEEPIGVNVKDRSISSIRFQWEAPRYANGNINVYILYFRQVQPAYYIPPYCSVNSIEASNTETSRLEAEFASLQPYSYYSVQIAARNEYGTGDFTLPVVERTMPSISDSVTNLKVVAINGPDVSSPTYKAVVNMTWLMPCKTNGEIDTFELEFEGIRTGYESVSFIRHVVPKYDDNGVMTYSETDLKPEYNYNVYISVVNKDVLMKSDFIKLSFQAPAGIPSKIVDTSSAKVDAFEASNPTISAVVRFPVDLLESASGTIVYAALLLSQKNCNPDPELLVGALDSSNEWPDSLSWENSYNGDECIRQYQTTPIRWQPVQPKAEDGSTGSGAVIEYTIGTDSCSNESSKRYCNGPLKADTEYQMVIRLFTKSSFSDAAILEFKTDSLIKLTLILIAVISCLIIAFIAGFIYLYITKKIIWHRESGHGIEDSSGDITSKNFAIFYNELSKRDKLQREFKELTVIATDLSFSASEANEYKNRYRDIFPYDKNRVILDIDADGNDYINASFINGYRRKKEYIATQGPKQESIADFWRMVLQHNVRIIVMVTQFKEEDVIKCHHYYPWEWKDIKVEIYKEDFFDLYDRREMLVTHTKQNIRRKIVHFYFKKWPDYGVPTDPMSLITFVRKVKSEKCPSDSPIVVHCSAGVGRTGTFIALDIIMQRLKSESKINIFESVKELRFQRMKMVQSMQQYTFLYNCVYQLVMHKRGKYNTNKKVSFKNDQDTALGTVQKEDVPDLQQDRPLSTVQHIGVADVECGISFKINNCESEL